MYTPAVEKINAPTLAIDMGRKSMRALLYIPDVGALEQSRFLLPAPERVLAERIAHHTNMRRTIYIHGILMGRSCVPAIKAHLAAGLGVSMHPRTAEAFSDNPQQLENMGIIITNTSPPLASSIKAADYDMDFWHSLTSMAGLPQPEVTLVAAFEDGRPFDGDGSAVRSQLLQEKFSTAGSNGLGMESLMPVLAPANFLRLSAIQRITKAPVADAFNAFVMGLLSLPAVAERSFREGILLVRVGNSFLRAGLVYQNRLFGVLELPVKSVEDVPQVIKHLEAFRLGWLPPEVAASIGGNVSVVSQLPAEAEGFRPMFVTGPRAGLLDGCGKMVNSYGGNIMGGCWGLLCGYSKMESVHKL